MDVVGPCHQMKSGIWKGNGKSVDGQQREAERRLNKRWKTVPDDSREAVLYLLVIPRDLLSAAYPPIQEFLRRLGGKESACQSSSLKTRECDPWIGELPWRRKWQPALVFLPGKSHGWQRLAGDRPWGCKVRHDLVRASLLSWEQHKIVPA